jgi:two-component system, OmpR family, sensor kinase
MKLPSSLTSRLVLTGVGLVAVISLMVSVATSLGMRTVLMDRLDRDVGGFAGGPPGGPNDHRPGLFVVYDDAGTVYQATYDSQRAEHQALTDGQARAVQKIVADGKVHDLDIPGLGSFRARGEQRFFNGVPVTAVNGMST